MKKDFLYPVISHYKSGYIKVSETPLHELYWEEYGNPQGDPVLFFHGGPGSGSKPKYARFFDPKYYRIILYDQRGSGKSRPHASLENNTTCYLIQDIAKLRKHLDIKGKMHLFGGSWGATLALAYAINFPEFVKSMTLRGIFLGRKQDIDFFYQGDAADPGNQKLIGAGQLFSDQYHHDKWLEYVEFIPLEERSNMVKAYHQRLNILNSQETERLDAAKHWVMWETAASKRIHRDIIEEQYTDMHYTLSLASIENHYAYNGIFWNEINGGSDNYILDNLGAIAYIPVQIVQGRYDMVCAKDQAECLYKRWKSLQKKGTKYSVQLHYVDDAGHSPSEPGMAEKLIEITNKFKTIRG